MFRQALSQEQGPRDVAGRFPAAQAWLTALVYGQMTRFFLWVPVWLGLGISFYFSVSEEPGPAQVAVAAAVALSAAALIVRGGDLPRVLGWAPLLVALGFLLAVGRAHQVAAPKLGAPYYGPVEGRVVRIDRSASNVPRVTLAEPWLNGVSDAQTPELVRVALHGEIAGTRVQPGARIALTANLSPPAGPVEPGGFDFQRKAWFDRLGGVGYSRAPPMLAVAPGKTGWRAQVFAWRVALADRLRVALPGQRGAFAAAILVGDRSTIDPARLEDLRRSNLAHLLAISGLHMGLLTGFVFGVIRFGVACIPSLALRWPSKKIAAVVALLAGAAYLVLSGANVATQRAFVMVAVMLLAVLFDRAAITLRAVALAAVIILVLRPESLTEPGFQMSFAATTALVASFETLNRTAYWRAMQRGRWRWMAPVLSLLMASSIAAAATAPVAAFHFNRIAQYGLIANLASVPVMGTVVMPAGVIAAVLAPFGMAGPALWVMGQGIGWILAVAQWVAGLDGAVTRIPSAPAGVLALAMGGLLFVTIWRGRARWLGTLATLAALAIWSGVDRPAVLVSASGKLVGIVGPDGRALTRERGDGFSASTWLENDGDGAAQPVAAARRGPGGKRWQWRHNGVVIAYDRAKKIAAVDLSARCREAAVVIVPNSRAPEGPGCLILDADLLAKGGSAALRIRDGAVEVLQARDWTGARAWNR